MRRVSGKCHESIFRFSPGQTFRYPGDILETFAAFRPETPGRGWFPNELEKEPDFGNGRGDLYKRGLFAERIC